VRIPTLTAPDPHSQILKCFSEFGREDLTDRYPSDHLCAQSTFAA
jgi:hypothetical protein